MRDLAVSTSTAFDTTWRNRAERSIAQGALTNSKRPQSFVDGIYPTHLSHGKGAFVYSADTGKRYIDFIGGLGTNLFGYGNEEIAKVITQAYLTGSSLSLGSPLEVECAELLQAAMPWVKRTKFLKTGTEACMAAVRIARASTGRRWVYSEGYHGWSDEFVALSPPARGAGEPDDLERLNSEQPWIQIDHETAAVIIEPIITDWSEERRQWLLNLQERCRKYGAWLICDEVITGYRWPKLSVSRWAGLEPDLICLGKAIGGGMPLAAVCGRDAKAMDDPQYFVSSTFAGDRTALAAFKAVHHMMKRPQWDLEDLWERGKLFIADFNRMMEGVVSIEGYPTRGVLKGGPLLKALFMQEACKAGLLFGPSFFFGFQHRELTQEVLGVIRDISLKIKLGGVELEGELPASPFAQQQREKA
jgi:glutamate-1-semialdehyde 2,1-aminomutase